MADIEIHQFGPSSLFIVLVALFHSLDVVVLLFTLPWLVKEVCVPLFNNYFIVYCLSLSR